MKRLKPRGFTLVEAMVALLLLGIVVQGGWAVFSNFRVAAERTALAAQGLETVRTVGWVLSEELDGARAGQDWWPSSDSSVSLRAFRGVAWVQEWENEGQVRVCYRGIRNPNPQKDSILTLSQEGVWVPRALEDRVRSVSGCAGENQGWVEIWQVEKGARGWRLARVFEVGSYHFSKGAFRYRVGEGGRQPLTAENLAIGSVHPAEGPFGGVRWALEIGIKGVRNDSIPWQGRVR